MLSGVNFTSSSIKYHRGRLCLLSFISDEDEYRMCTVVDLIIYYTFETCGIVPKGETIISSILFASILQTSPKHFPKHCDLNKHINTWSLGLFHKPASIKRMKDSLRIHLGTHYSLKVRIIKLSN